MHTERNNQRYLTALDFETSCYCRFAKNILYTLLLSSQEDVNADLKQVLCDKDQDGLLNDEEMNNLQKRCFNRVLSDTELDEIKLVLRKASSSGSSEEGITERGFILLNKIFAEKGRHETTWTILRAFHYTDNLSLEDNFLHPK